MTCGWSEVAARKLLEIANAIEPVQGRVHIEKINGPFLFPRTGDAREQRDVCSPARVQSCLPVGWQVQRRS